MLTGISLTGQELETLLYAPLWVFFAVAGADGKLDDFEAAAMNQELRSAEQYNQPLFRQVMSALREHFDSLQPRFMADPRNCAEGLRDVRRLLDAKLAADQAAAFKQSLLYLGRTTAEAGGPGAPGGGVLQMPKASFDEQDVLIDISIMLGLQEGVRPLSPWVSYMLEQ